MYTYPIGEHNYFECGGSIKHRLNEDQRNVAKNQNMYRFQDIFCLNEFNKITT